MRVVAFDVGIVNFAFCIADIELDCNPSILACANARIGNAKDPIAVLITNLATFLNENKIILQDKIEIVKIEQQVAMKASKNQSLSAALYMFYKDLMLTDNSTVREVQFVNPRAKFKQLRACPLAILDPFRDILKETRGPALKKLSIQLATLVSEHWNCEIAIDALKNAKKKDDISDCLLYACFC